MLQSSRAKINHETHEPREKDEGAKAKGQLRCFVVWDLKPRTTKYTKYTKRLYRGVECSSMHKFVRSLITEWRKLGLPLVGETIVVAVSGGADSMALLLAIEDLVKRKKLKLRVIVAHFNHKLRGNASDADEAYVRRSAAELGFEFESRSGKVGGRRGNLEQNARESRYVFLGEVAKKSGASAVLTAHTVDDQAETFLINLIRGSGPDGLAGMAPVRPFHDDIVLVRPLLDWARRSDTERLCSDNEIEFRLDSMNSDERFTRVKVRNTILPLLRDLNPRIVEALARTAGLLRHSQTEKYQRPNRLSNSDTEDQLELSRLKGLPKADLYAQLRSWLRKTRGNVRSLQLKHIEGIERLILSRRSGKTVELPGGGEVVKHGGRLSFRNIKVEK